MPSEASLDCPLASVSFSVNAYDMLGSGPGVLPGVACLLQQTLEVGDVLSHRRMPLF